MAVALERRRRRAAVDVEMCVDGEEGAQVAFPHVADRVVRQDRQPNPVPTRTRADVDPRERKHIVLSAVRRSGWKDRHHPRPQARLRAHDGPPHQDSPVGDLVVGQRRRARIKSARPGASLRS